MTLCILQWLCTTVAALLHYFFLAVFCWMLCEGVMLYLLSHIYVTALSTTSSPLKVMERYAIEVGNDQWLIEGEVQNPFS